MKSPPASSPAKSELSPADAFLVNAVARAAALSLAAQVAENIPNLSSLEPSGTPATLRSDA